MFNLALNFFLAKNRLSKVYGNLKQTEKNSTFLLLRSSSFECGKKKLFFFLKVGIFLSFV